MPPVAAPRSEARAPRHGALRGARDPWSLVVPAAICAAGERAAVHSAEYFAARLTNKNTSAVYARAVTEFCDWCLARGSPSLPSLSLANAAYMYGLRERLRPSTANVHLTAVRQWLEWLTAVISRTA